MKLLAPHPVPACHITSPTTPPCWSYHYSIPFHSIPFQFHFTLSIPATRLDPVRRVRGLGEPLVRVHTLRSCVVIPQHTQCHQLHPVSLSLPLHVTLPALPHHLWCLLVYSHWLTTAWTQQTGGTRSPLLTRSGVWLPPSAFRLTRLMVTQAAQASSWSKSFTTSHDARMSMKTCQRHSLASRL